METRDSADFATNTETRSRHIRSLITSYPRNNGLASRYRYRSILPDRYVTLTDTFSIAESKVGNDLNYTLINLITFILLSFVATTCRFNHSFARSFDILAPTTCTRQQVALDNDTRPANAFSSTLIYFLFTPIFFHIENELNGASSCQNFRAIVPSSSYPLQRSDHGTSANVDSRLSSRVQTS